MEQYIRRLATHQNENLSIAEEMSLVGEEPLSIMIQGKPYSVTMRTPGDEIAHIAGFCLGEGMIDAPEDIISTDSDNHTVMITLKSEKSDGEICPLPDSPGITPEQAVALMDALSEHQPLRRQTHATHAAALCGLNGDILSSAEDVGRHNALDKAVGKLFLIHQLDKASILLLSSRISFELVQKAARARIPMILSVSRPTASAVKLASELNMTLACLARGGGIYVFCGEKRLKGEL
jgi:FdhD protein